MRVEQPFTVHLVDDDPSVRDACRFMLEGYGCTVRYWPDGEQFLAAAKLHAEGVVILDLRMPGLDGSEVHARLQAQDSTLGVIMLTAHGDVCSAVSAMKQGAVDFLQKPVRGRALVEAISVALERSRERVAQRELQQRMGQLSEREREIAERIVQGQTNREIAAELFLSVRTIEVHRASLMKKLGAESMAQLIGMWQQGQPEA